MCRYIYSKRVHTAITTSSNNTHTISSDRLEPKSSVLCVLRIYTFGISDLENIFRVNSCYCKGVSFSGLRFVQRKLFQEVIKCVWRRLKICLINKTNSTVCVYICKNNNYTSAYSFAKNFDKCFHAAIRSNENRLSN